MIRRRRPSRPGRAAPAASGDFHDVFAVECEPLRLRRVWLATDLVAAPDDDPRVALIVPLEMAWRIEDAGTGTVVELMPGGQGLVRVDTAGREHIEMLVLSAYEYAFL